MSRRAKENIWITVKILIGVLTIFPLIVTFLLSFQSTEELGTLPFTLFTAHPTLEHYRYALQSYNVPLMLRNTLIIIVMTIPTAIVLDTATAYAFAHYNFKFKGVLFTVVLSVMMIPGEVTIMTNYMTIQRMGLMNTYLAVCITGLVDAASIFMLRQHMMSLPPALWEAAKVDGCGDLRYLFSVMIPLSKSIIVAFTLTGFIGVYNSYMWPMLVTSDRDMQPIAVCVGMMMEDISLNPGGAYAGTIIAMIIPLIVYIFGVDRIVEGITAGAVKN